MTYPWSMNDRFMAAFPKGRGLTLGSVPPGINPNIQGDVNFQAPLPPVAVQPPVNQEPYRMQGNPAEYQAWRSGASRDAAQGLTAQPVPPVPADAPYARPAAFPAGGTAPIANVAAPQGPGGITLNNTPVAPGWAGTVGLPATPEASSAFDKGADWQKMLNLAGDVAKGIKGKAPQSTDMNTITPMSPSPVGGGGGQMGAELLAQLLSARRRNYGVG